MNTLKNFNFQDPIASKNNRNNVSNRIITGYPQQNRRSLRRIGGLVDFLLPAVIHLTSKQQTPEWRVGFCLNGHAFANRNPFAEKCPSYTLPVRWNLLYMCPPIPRYCRIPECQSNNTVYGEHFGCPYTCRASIFCGDTSDRVNVVYTWYSCIHRTSSAFDVVLVPLFSQIPVFYLYLSEKSKINFLVIPTYMRFWIQMCYKNCPFSASWRSIIQKSTLCEYELYRSELCVLLYIPNICVLTNALSYYKAWIYRGSTSFNTAPRQRWKVVNYWPKKTSNRTNK